MEVIGNARGFVDYERNPDAQVPARTRQRETDLLWQRCLDARRGETWSMRLVQLFERDRSRYGRDGAVRK